MSRCCGARRSARSRSATPFPLRKEAGRRDRTPAVHVRRLVLRSQHAATTHATGFVHARRNWRGASRWSCTATADARVAGVATLARAGRDELAFLANPRYRASSRKRDAGIVVMRAGDAEGHAGTALLADDPVRRVRANLPRLFDIARRRDAGHPCQCGGRSPRRARRSGRADRRRSPASARAARSPPAPSIGPGCVDRRGLRRRRGLRHSVAARDAGQARPPGQARADPSWRGARRRRLRPGDGRRALAEGAAAGRRGGRRRLRDRRQHHDRSRRARRHRARGRRAPRQPDPDRPQRRTSARTPRWPAAPRSPAARASAATA